MMDEQLLLQSLLWRTERLFGDRKIITRLETGRYHEYTYREFGQRVRKLASALEKAGVQRGDRVGTLAWNHYRHLELYYAIPAVEAICHTINMRLFPDQQRYIVNHAEDTMLFLDADQIANVEKMIDEGGIGSVGQFVVLCEAGELPETSLAPVTSYEEFIATGDDDFEFRDFSERTAAAMCYTSATTGDPKGVIYSHRGIVLQTTEIQGIGFCLELLYAHGEGSEADVDVLATRWQKDLAKKYKTTYVEWRHPLVTLTCLAEELGHPLAVKLGAWWAKPAPAWKSELTLLTGLGAPTEDRARALWDYVLAGGHDTGQLRTWLLMRARLDGRRPIDIADEVV